MPSVIKKTFKSLTDPLLKKAGIKTTSPVAGETTMGAILRFILINAISVIGAKLISEATERVSKKVFHDNDPNDATKMTAAETKVPAAPALETKHCKKCGAFVIQGQSCDCV
jgi:hypothetical protein